MMTCMTRVPQAPSKSKKVVNDYFHLLKCTFTERKHGKTPLQTSWKDFADFWDQSTG